MTREQVEALESRERKLYGDGGDVKSGLANERERLDRESWRRLLPGYVRRFIEKSAPLLKCLGIDGDLDGTFALDSAGSRARSTFSGICMGPVCSTSSTASHGTEAEEAIRKYLPAPGEPVFVKLRTRVCERFAAAEARRGAVFTSTHSRRPHTSSFSRPFRCRAGPTPPFRALPEPRSWITAWSGCGNTRTESSNPVRSNISCS